MEPVPETARQVAGRRVHLSRDIPGVGKQGEIGVVVRVSEDGRQYDIKFQDRVVTRTVGESGGATDG